MSRQLIGVFDFKKLRLHGINIFSLMQSANYCAIGKSSNDWKEFSNLEAPYQRSNLPIWAVFQRIGAGYPSKPNFSRYHSWSDEDEKISQTIERDVARQKLLEMHKHMVQQQDEKIESSTTLKLVF